MYAIEIQATGHHPFYVVSGNRLESRPLPLVIPEDELGMFGSGRWVEARHLEVGDILRRMDGEGLSITSLSSRNEKTTVYHLEIEGIHTFGVHETGILVHNKSAKGDSSSSGKGGSLARFAIVDNYLYTLSGSNMQLYDISNPAKPIVWKKIEVGWDIETIFPYEDKLFIGGQRGMYIYDNSDPAQPIQISKFAHVTSCDPVVVEDDTAFVTLRGGTRCGGQNNRLEIIDISNTRKPHLIAAYPMDGPYGLGIDRGLLFICDGNAGLKLFDATKPKALKLVRRFSGLKTLDVILHRDIAIVVGETGLHQYDYRELAKMKLISVINTRDDGYSALMKAVKHGHIKIVRSLLQSGVDVNTRSTYGRTALMEAVMHGHTEIVGLLLQVGADVNARHGDGGWTALVRAEHHDNLAIMELLIQAGADVNAGYEVGGWTALMWGAWKGNTEMVELLLQAEADVNGMDDEGETALMWGAWKGSTEMVDLLIQAKADVNVSDEDGETALEISARYGYTEVVQILLDAGADVNAGSSYGRTALLSAAFGGYTEAVKMLLDAGADVNVLNKDGKSAMMLAYERGHTAIIDMLREAGAEE
jgi:ankyrin repeat protein